MVRGQPDRFGPSAPIRQWHVVGDYIVSDTMEVFNADGQRMPPDFVPTGEDITVETYYHGKARYAYYPTEREQYIRGDD